MIEIAGGILLAVAVIAIVAIIGWLVFGFIGYLIFCHAVGGEWPLIWRFRRNR